MLQNTEDAEDITQEVFVQVFHSLSKFSDKAALSTWIYSIAVNKSLDHLKSKKRKKRFAFLTQLFHPETGEVLHENPHFDHPGVILENKERTQMLFSALNKIPDSQKSVFVLSKIEGFSTKEIAGILSISDKAVESLNQRAKENLKKILENYYHQRGI